jgi:hypothetical protein
MSIRETMKGIILLLFIVPSFIGCSSYETQTLSGEITGINKEKQIIQIEGKPIKLPYVNAYEIGQKVTVTYLNKSGEDCWCPDNFEVIDVEDMKFRKD